MNSYTYIERSKEVDHKIELDVIGAGTQSTVVDVSDKVMKRTKIEQVQSINSVLQQPIKHLRMFGISQINDELIYYQDKLIKHNFVFEDLFTVLLELKTLNDHGFAYNDLVDENIVGGHLCDNGLIDEFGKKLIKYRPKICVKDVSCKENDINGFRLWVFDIIKYKIKSDDWTDMWEELSEITPDEVCGRRFGKALLLLSPLLNISTISSISLLWRNVTVDIINNETAEFAFIRYSQFKNYFAWSLASCSISLFSVIFGSCFLLSKPVRKMSAYRSKLLK